MKKIVDLDIDKIEVNKNQPRKYFNEEKLAELAQSIKTNGIIQPLSVRRKGLDNYEIVSGERRYRAAKIAGLSFVPCIIVVGDEKKNNLTSIIENIQREDLNFYEEALAYKKLMDEFSLTQEQIAEQVGKKQSTISNMIRLLNLDEDVLEIIIENGLTQRHARCLLSLPDRENRLEAVNEIVKKDLNVKNTELLVERLKSEIVINSKKTNVKNIFNYRIYTNTIKQAYKNIVNTGLDCDYKEKNYDDRIEVVITIPKNK